MKIQTKVVGLLLYLSAAAMFAGTVKVGGQDWYDNLAEAKTAAASSGKPIYIYFTGGERCGWCVKMKGETFSNDGVKRDVLGKVVLVMLNVWVNPDSAALARDKAVFSGYGGRGVPFNVVLDSRGGKISTFGGFLPPDKFTGKMNTVIEIYGKYRKTALKASGDGATYADLMAHLKNCEDLEKTGEAGKTASRLRALDPSDSRGDGASLELVIARSMREKDPDGALKRYRSVLALDADNGKKAAEKAVREALYLLYMNKKYGEILLLGKKGLTLPAISNESKAWYNLLIAFGHKESGKKTEAVAAFRIVLRLVPNSRWARVASYWVNKLSE